MSRDDRPEFTCDRCGYVTREPEQVARWKQVVQTPVTVGSEEHGPELCMKCVAELRHFLAPAAVEEP